jgi:hypothetical protein
MPAAIVGYFANYDFYSISNLFMILFVIHTSLLLYIAKYTYGEKLMNIKLKSLKSNEINKIVLILRNIVFCIFLYLIADNLDNLFKLVFHLFLFLTINITVFAKNKNQKPMSIIDFLFSTYYENIKLG